MWIQFLPGSVPIKDKARNPTGYPFNHNPLTAGSFGIASKVEEAKYAKFLANLSKDLDDYSFSRYTDELRELILTGLAGFGSSSSIEDGRKRIRWM